MAGYFSFRFANHVGAAGRVYAVDINPDMVLHMNRRIRDLGLENVQTVLAPPDDPLVQDRSVEMRVSREETVGEFERNGFKAAAEYTFVEARCAQGRANGGGA